MSKTLNLVDSLLTMGRNLQKFGRSRDALQIFQRLSGFRSLTAELAEEVQSRLADLHQTEDDFAAARRHLTAALTYRPQHAEYYHRMALLIEADPDADLDRARRYHRQATRCEPDNAGYWADFGIHLLNVGREEIGRKVLRRAFRLGVGDPELIGEIADALRQAGFWSDARRVVLRALFRSPRDRRFKALWQQQQFEELRRQQSVQHEHERPAPSGPIRLPFVRSEGESTPREVNGKILRFDLGGERSEPKLPQRSPRKGHNRRTN